MKKRYFPLIVFIASLIALGIMSWTAAAYFLATQEIQRTHDDLVAQQITSLEQQLKQAEIKIDLLVAENKSVAEKIQEEIANRAAAENKLNQTIVSSKSPDLSAVIGRWKKAVARLRCSFETGDVASTKASAVLFLNVSKNHLAGLVTNLHAVEEKGIMPSTCTAEFPDNLGTLSVTTDNIQTSKKDDWAILEIPSLPAQLQAVAAVDADRCNSTPTLGNGIVILGYPAIGAKNDITATEGIVSAFDGNYIITSAKVERGNSGGGAILTKQNCYLGIPSFVGTGGLESLARILDQKIIGF